MKKLFINGRFLEQSITGVQRYAIETLRALDEVITEDANCLIERPILLVPPNAKLPFILNSIDIVECGLCGGHIWEQFFLRRKVGSNFLLNFNYTAPLFFRDQIITLHDVTPLVYPRTFTRKFLIVFYIYLKLLLKRVDTVMTVSEFSKREILQRLRLKRSIVVGYEGYEHSVYRDDNLHGILKKFGLESGQYLLLVGSIKPNKNIKIVAEALDLIKPFPLKIVVAGAMDRKVFDTSQKFGDVVYLGYVGDADLKALYRGALWYVFPSLYEGFGLPALEALANGCPVISSNAGSLPEICGKAALYFDPNSSKELSVLLSNIFDDQSLRKKVLCHANERLDSYGWKKNAHVILSVLSGKLG